MIFFKISACSSAGGDLFFCDFDDCHSAQNVHDDREQHCASIVVVVQNEINSCTSVSLLIFIYPVEYMYLSRCTMYLIFRLQKLCIYLFSTCWFSTFQLCIVYFISYGLDESVLVFMVSIAGVISASFSGVCKLNNSSK